MCLQIPSNCRDLDDIVATVHVWGPADFLHPCST